MIVSIVGSWKDEDVDRWGLKDRDSFAEACSLIGEAVVSNGHTLLVGSESERTADFYAVGGAVRRLKLSTFNAPRIVVLRPNDKQFVFADMRKQYPKLFTVRESPESKWDLTGAFQIKEADAVIVVGGGRRSYQVGLWGAVSGKRVLPIGSFGGAAKQLAVLFSSTRPSWLENIPTSDELGQLHSPWSVDLLAIIKEVARLDYLPQVLIIHGRDLDRLVLKNYLQSRLRLPEPRIMGEEPASTDPLPIKFERLARRVDAAIAVVTPDDEGRLASSTEPLEKRARQNVWLEVGWFWGRLGRERLLLLCKGDLSIPSDLSGVEYVRYTSEPSEAADAIRRFIEGLAQNLT